MHTWNRGIWYTIAINILNESVLAALFTLLPSQEPNGECLICSSSLTSPHKPTKRTYTWEKATLELQKQWKDCRVYETSFNLRTSIKSPECILCQVHKTNLRQTWIRFKYLAWDKGTHLPITTSYSGRIILLSVTFVCGEVTASARLLFMT